MDKHARHILKPQSEYYPEMLQNEAITMTLAETIGIEVPLHGLIYSKDNSMTYFIKRFDRIAYHKKLAVEDFTQLLGLQPETKYEGSMEKVTKVISDFCSFPKIELEKIFKITLFNFLIRNEDMYLKNFSLITRDQKIMLSPAYDLLNSTIAQKNPQEELALPLNGKKNNLNKNDFLEYFAIQRLGLNQKIITNITQEIKQAVPNWKTLINHSFLSASMQEKYIDLLDKRYQQLFL